MKRLIVPAIAMGLAIAFAQPASAGHLLDGLGHNGCCKPECPKPACKPSCLPKLDLHRCCPKPECKPACPRPCDPCDRGHHLGSKLKDCLGKLRHRDKCCDPCGAPAPEPAPAASAFESTPGPRLTPTPSSSTTSMRPTRRSAGF